MKTVYKYIKFVQSIDAEVKSSWVCYNTKVNYRLGWVEWNSRWKCWQFCPADNTAFTTDCLADIIHFLKQLAKEPT